MKYHDIQAEICENFAEAGRLLIYACGRIIQNSMSGQGCKDAKNKKVEKRFIVMFSKDLIFDLNEN